MYQKSLNISSGVYCVKNNPSEVRSDLCKVTGIGEEQILVSNFSISSYGGKIWVSAWSLDRKKEFVALEEILD